MRLSTYLPLVLAVLLGALACFGIAVAAVSEVEGRSADAVRTALAENGQSWADVDVDGLQVILSGTAPDEGSRFDAVAAAGTVVDGARLIDRMSVTETQGPAGPAFTIEILRNDDGISLIGLIPSATDRDALATRIGELAGTGRVTDLLETIDAAVPADWLQAVEFGLEALATLERSKISIMRHRVEVTAIARSVEEKARLETRLRRRVPGNLVVSLDIAAPRPVITPFTVRFVIDESGPHFDACAAESETGQASILRAAAAAGVPEPTCTIGIGRPSSDWPRAVTMAMETLRGLGQGTVTLSDVDVHLIVPATVEAEAFERAAAELEADLPPVFALTATRLEPEPGPVARSTPEDGPPDFTATLSPEGLAWMRGRLPDELTRTAVESYANARFGLAATDFAARLDPDLPPRWPIRVLTALEALARLNNGVVRVEEAKISVKGATGDTETQGEIARLMSARLGERASYTLDITYLEELDPVAALPTPEECLARVSEALGTRKITFEPGSTNIEADALPTLDRLAEALTECQTVPMEIQGHTDSQGRESMNLRLSQARADAVLNALIARRVLTSNIVAKGYGESEPIEDNGTEEGREANRRIEFSLILSQDEETPAEGTENEQN